MKIVIEGEQLDYEAGKKELILEIGGREFEDLKLTVDSQEIIVSYFDLMGALKALKP